MYCERACHARPIRVASCVRRWTAPNGRRRTRCHGGQAGCVGRCRSACSTTTSAMAALAHRRDPAHDVHAAAVSRLLFSSSPPVDHGCGQLVPGDDSLDEPADLSAGVRALQEPLPLCRDVLRIRAGWHALVFRSHHPCGFRPIGRRRYCDACRGFRPTSSPPSGAASLPLCEL